MKKDSYRREHKRLYWRVTVRWNYVDMDGRVDNEEVNVWRFPSNYSESDALEAASDKWDGMMDWLPSEHARCARTYRAVAKLVRTCDVGAFA